MEAKCKVDRTDQVVNEIMSTNSDIIDLQEVTAPMYDTLIKRLDYITYSVKGGNNATPNISSQMAYLQSLWYAICWKGAIPKARAHLCTTQIDLRCVRSCGRL